MKTLRVSLVLLFLGVPLFSQDAVPPPAATGAQGAVKRTPQELEQLLGPIALYPDALIALILPAATVPTDIVLAARHTAENPGDRSQIEHRAWDDSVKSLTSYPEVLAWMDENLQWTQQVGEAFSVQPADVMQAIQRLRAKARAAGTLVDTPQQQVLAEPNVIRIVPAQPDIIYVPYYEPEIVFVDRPVYYGRPYLTFGAGVVVGSWLAFDCDWHRHSIWVGNRHRRWTGHDWHRPVVPFSATVHVTRTPEVRQWRPSPHSPRSTFAAGHRFRSEIARPTPISTTTVRTYSPRPSGSGNWDRRNHDSSPLRTANPLPMAPNSRSEGEAPGPRVANPPNRSASYTAPRAVNPLPMAPTNQPVGEVPGPRAANPSNRSSSSFTAPRVDAAPTVAPSVPSSSPSRRSGGDGSRDNDSRSRGTRGNQNNASAPLPAVPSLPMATPHQAPAAGPVSPRSFSRSAESSASPPAVVPSLPMANRAPSTPPPTVVAPAAPAAAPAAQPAAPAPRDGESRGYRGGGRREDRDQAR